MVSVSGLEEDEWVLYHWQESGPGSAERIGKIVDLDPLTLVPPGSYEDLAFEIDPSQLTRRWVPEGIPDAGKGQPGEPIKTPDE